MSKLREDEYLFSFLLTLLKKFLNQDHFSTCCDKLFKPLLLSSNFFEQIMFDFLDKERVIAAFSELDLQIVEVGVV